VAGGAGFLGSHLCKRLVRDGHYVLCVDNFLTGKRENLNSLIDHPAFELIEADICFELNFLVDEIYNLACPASPFSYQANPIETLKANVLGALNLLEIARKNGCKIFQASTSEVYGDPSVHPQVEEYWGCVNPIGIRACYDEGKRCAETCFFDYWRTYGIRIKVGRIFNTYGPFMHPHDGRVVSNFIVQALKGEPLTIYGDGTQTRSFCYVDDLIEGIVLLMNTPDEIRGPVNLGNPVEFKMVDLAHQILALSGSSSHLVFQPLPSDDPRQRCPDISKAKQLLNWAPEISLVDGLLKTIQYFVNSCF
jgi:UDP-glucuronate decarboxylase